MWQCCVLVFKCIDSYAFKNLHNHVFVVSAMIVKSNSLSYSYSQVLQVCSSCPFLLLNMSTPLHHADKRRRGVWAYLGVLGFLTLTDPLCVHWALSRKVCYLTFHAKGLTFTLWRRDSDSRLPDHDSFTVQKTLGQRELAPTTKCYSCWEDSVLDNTDTTQAESATSTKEIDTSR